MVRRGLARLACAAVFAAGCGGSKGTAPPPADGFGVAWSAAGTQPALAARPCPNVDCFGMGDPALGRLADGSLAVWYTGGGTSGGPFLLRSRLDATLAPTRQPDAPLLAIAAPGTWDRFAETPSLAPDSASGHWRMAYLGYADTGFVAPAIGVMLSADSAGTTWSRPAAPAYRPTSGAWDGVFVTGPSVARGPDGVWRIWYAGAGTTVGIGLLTSPDGVTWTAHPDNPVFERRLGQWDEATLEPCVRWLRGRWWMWYSGYREPLDSGTRIGIGLAVSDDGVHWTRVGDGPVLGPGPAGAWNDLRVLAPDVIVEPDGSLLMTAYGQKTTDPGQSLGSIAFWRSR